ncbi:MoaF-related domain-containing protein [Amycolatopsis sp. NPDC049868]|uniref:MoaF-related domain-containing protein n=1 Tax=Amycolatopsis sp. NPDC049868 TaxID=3363934 RepID=UPI0037996838
MTDFPLTGQIWKVDYGGLVMQHDYRVPGKISFPLPEGGVATTDLSVAQVREDVYVLWFQGVAATVLAIEDLSAHTANSFMIFPDRTEHYLGKLIRVDDHV